MSTVNSAASYFDPLRRLPSRPSLRAMKNEMTADTSIATPIAMSSRMPRRSAGGLVCE